MKILRQSKEAELKINNNNKINELKNVLTLRLTN